MPAGTNYWVSPARTGASLPAAGTEVGRATRRIRRAFSRRKPGEAEGEALKQQVGASARQPLLVLFGAVALVLLIACTNIGGLLITRLMARQRSWMSGQPWARPGRLARELFVEALLLAVLGGAVGVVVAAWASTWSGLGARHASATGRGGAELAHVVFAAASSGIAALLFGVLPAFRRQGHETAPARDRTA